MSKPRRHLHVLRILPCDESFADMGPARGGPDALGPGRHCATCEHDVLDTTALTEAELERILARAAQRVCVRAQIVAGRPRLASGLAASFLAVALAGCASPSSQARALEQLAFAELAPEAASFGDQRGVIAGVILDAKGRPLVDAYVEISSTEQSRVQWSGARGAYAFVDLPPGIYTVIAMHERSQSSQVAILEVGQQLRANFRLDDDGEELLLGMFIRPAIPMDASSTIRSNLVWLD